MWVDDNYCIESGYRPNPQGALTLDAGGRHYWNEVRLRASYYYQYHVYRRARRIAQERRLQNVIDLGCGPGTKMMQLLAPACRRVVGIDQETIIPVCKKRYPHGEFYADNFHAPILHLQLTGQFDLVVCADVIEHVNDPDILIGYIMQVARDGAYLVISTPERNAVRGPNCVKCTKHDHVREWNRTEFSRYLVSRGMEIVEHRLVPQQGFNLSRNYFKASMKAFQSRRPFRSCQMAVCRILKWTPLSTQEIV